MKVNGEDIFSDVIHVAPNTNILDVEFDDGYGGTEGPAFTLWTKDNVYFPVCYDGAEWVCSVPRNPCDVASTHVGGS